MARFFNGKKIELLAPSGTMETFREVVQANCDAIYIGGQKLNMRMIRKGYNFSNEQICEALNISREKGKKLYVTVNNLVSNDEINEAVEYLDFLNSISIDGIIVQDTGILQICQDHQFNQFEIHSSVMMNAHNLEFVKALQKCGVSRVVLPREMDLKTAKLIQNHLDIETEYFIHGDMCTVNGSNCYYSSFIWGNSSNCGRCFKPCRWPYRVKKDGYVYKTEFPLAAKDMYMYEHIPELIDACVTSFKIEGRMRETDFIVDLVNTYGDAIDRYLDNPLAFQRKQGAEELYNNRKRDFTTAYAFSESGLDFINTRYEGTGKFYSTGKVFSTPTEEPKLTDRTISKMKEEFSSYNIEASSSKKLSVKVNNFEQAKACVELDVERIYLPSEVLLPDTPLTSEQLKQLVIMKKDTELYLDLPQMMDELQFDIIDQYLDKHGIYFDGLLVSNLGAIAKYGTDYKVITDYNINIFNAKAMEFYEKLGACEFTASIEMKSDQLANFISTANMQVELIVHGPLRVMYLNHNLYKNTDYFSPEEKEDNFYVDNQILTLCTDKGENPVYIDQNRKNHLYTSKEFCMLPILEHLQFGEKLRYRIEGQTYTTEELKTIIKVYQEALAYPASCQELFASIASVRAGYTAGCLSYKSTKQTSVLQ
ncbi:MAG: U32 family peptidase [Niallia nealsonii]|nr:U32 family peptidase [Niallia nealsonii]